MLHGDVGALHFPLVVVGRNSIDGGLVAFWCRVMQRGDEAILHRGVVVNQLSQRAETAF